MTDTPNPATLPVVAIEYQWADRPHTFFPASPQDAQIILSAPARALTAHAPAQAAIDQLRADVERLKAEKQEQALQALSNDGQWIEHTGKLQTEVERLRAALSDLTEWAEGASMALDNEFGDGDYSEEPCLTAARESLKATKSDAAMSSLPGEGA